MRKENLDNNEISREISFSISLELTKAVSDARRLLPANRSRLEMADIILAIAVTEGRGEDLLKALTLEEFPQFVKILKNTTQHFSFPNLSSGEMQFEGRKIDYGPGVSRLFEKAKDLAGGQPISTDDVVLAELSRPASFITKTLKVIETPEPILELAQAISDRIIYKEKGNSKGVL